MVFIKFIIEFFVIGKDLLVDNYFIYFKNIWIKLVGILCVFFMISIFIIMINDELWFIKLKEWFCDMKNVLLYLVVICIFCKVLIMVD